MTTVPPTGTPPATPAAPYVPSVSPGRMVEAGSIANQLLHLYGLLPQDVLRAVEGGPAMVTTDEVVAELARRGVTVERVWEGPPLSEAVVRPRIRALLALGAHLVRLRPWSKAPAMSAWQDQPALTEDEAVAWVTGGGNLGINMGRSGENGWAGIDSECWAVTRRLIAEGLTPTVTTANGQVSDSPKSGGAHFHFPLPATGIDPLTLRTTVGVELEGLGTLDVLMGARVAVAPCSRLITAPDRIYDFAAQFPGALMGGPLAGYTADHMPVLNPAAWTPPPAWLTDESVAVAADLQPIAAVIATPKPKPRRAPDPNADAITQQVDELDWVSDVVAGDPRIIFTGGWTRCGCPQIRFAAATSPTSGHFHDCSEFGSGFHLYSTTTMRLLNVEAHGSKLTFAAALRDRLDDMGSVARELGIDMGGFATANPVPIPPPPASQALAPAMLVLAPGGAVPAEGEVEADDDDDYGDDDGDGSKPKLTPEARARIKQLRAEIAIRERRLATLTPGLARADRWARSSGVYLHGFVSAAIVRTIANIPPNVLLPNPAGLTFSKEIGGAINANALLVGPSATGKSVTLALARAALRLTTGVVSTSDGTAEGICKKARITEKGRIVILATGVLVEADEFDGVRVEMERVGSKLDNFTRKVYTGAAAGSTASDKNRDAQLPAHSTRVCMLYGAQPQALGVLLEQADRGTPQRYDLASVGVVRKAERDPELYGRTVEPLLINQDRLPWATPVGLPAGYRPPNPSDDDAESECDETAGLIGFDDAPPIWIRVPQVVRDAIEAEAERAAARSENWLHAIAEDDAGISGHNVLLLQRFAVAIATWDGVCHFGVEHWEAATLLIEMRQLVMEAAADVAKLQAAKSRAADGTAQGIQTAAAQDAIFAHTNRAYRGCVKRLFRLIDAAAGLLPGDPKLAKVIAANPKAFSAGGLDVDHIDAILSDPQRKQLPGVLRDLKLRRAITGVTGVIYRTAAGDDSADTTETDVITVRTGSWSVPPAPAPAA